MITFDEGKELLKRLREMSLYADSYGKHATTSACYSIEHSLEILNDRRHYLEELWLQRKNKLEQCIQICYLKDEIKKVQNLKLKEIKIIFFIFKLKLILVASMDFKRR